MGEKGKDWDKAMDDWEKVTMVERGRESVERTTKAWSMTFADEDFATNIARPTGEGQLKISS